MFIFAKIIILNNFKLILKELHIINYRNISEKTIELDPVINAFIGKNGVGKTNILDAIYHLSLGKSYFNPIAIQNVMHDKDFYLIEGFFDNNNKQEHIVCSFKIGQKKVLKRNGKIYDKLSEHVGLIPVVIISPSDTDLIHSGSEFRRKFFDGIISSLDAHYLNTLINYQKVLGQRNALLKYFAVNQLFDELSLSIYDEQLVAYGNTIYNKRKSFLEQYNLSFQDLYYKISDNSETVNIIYNSQLETKDFSTLLSSNLYKDRLTQYTNFGIHKDDFLFELQNYPVKKFGSQGQKKSFLIALKLSHFEIVKNKLKQSPILLFDDVFDKLDEMRVEKIVKMVNDDVFGQIFITDTHIERMTQVLNKMLKSYKTCIL